MNDDDYHYSFIDESGTTSPFSGSRFFIVALFDTLNPRKVELHVRRLHKRFGTSLKSGEMKASESQVKTIRRFLSTIAREQVEIIAIIVDKKIIARTPKNNEIIYIEGKAGSQDRVLCRNYGDDRRTFQEHLAAGVDIKDALEVEGGVFKHIGGDCIHSYDDLYDDDFEVYGSEEPFLKGRVLTELSRARKQFVEDHLRLNKLYADHVGDYDGHRILVAKPNKMPLGQVLYFEGHAQTDYEEYRGVIDPEYFEEPEFIGYMADGIHTDTATRPLWKLRVRAGGAG